MIKSIIEYLSNIFRKKRRVRGNSAIIMSELAISLTSLCWTVSSPFLSSPLYRQASRRSNPTNDATGLWAPVLTECGVHCGTDEMPGGEREYQQGWPVGQGAKGSLDGVGKCRERAEYKLDPQGMQLGQRLFRVHRQQLFKNITTY